MTRPKGAGAFARKIRSLDKQFEAEEKRHATDVVTAWVKREACRWYGHLMTMYLAFENSYGDFVIAALYERFHDPKEPSEFTSERHNWIRTLNSVQVRFIADLAHEALNQILDRLEDLNRDEGYDPESLEWQAQLVQTLFEFETVNSVLLLLPACNPQPDINLEDQLFWEVAEQVERALLVIPVRILITSDLLWAARWSWMFDRAAEGPLEHIKLQASAGYPDADDEPCDDPLLAFSVTIL